MGACRHCGEDAGFLRRAHGDCERTFKDTRAAMVAHVAKTVVAPDLDAEALRAELAAIAAGVRVGNTDTRAVLAKGWSEAAARAIDAGFTREQEARLRAFRTAFALTDREMGHTLARLAEASHDLLRSEILSLVRRARGNPATLRAELPSLPSFPYRFDRGLFILQKSERLIWMKDDVEYWKEGVERKVERTKKYTKTTTSRGMKHQATGVLGVTTKHVYFCVPDRPSPRFRIRYASLASIDVFEGGLGRRGFALMRGSASAKCEGFMTNRNEGNFLFDLVLALAQV